MNEGSNQYELLIQIENDDSLRRFTYRNTSAWIGNIPLARYLIRAMKPNLFVELGTHFGVSYFNMCDEISRVNYGGKAFAIDNWIGDKHSGFYSNEVFEIVQEENKKYEFSTLLRMQFHDALNSFENESIDLLHIDGEHTFESVSQDFELWLPKMKSDGVILVHDIGVFREDFGVWKFWDQVKQKYKTFETFHSFGLGIIFLETEIANPNLRIIESSGDAWKNRFHSAFSNHASVLLLDQIEVARNLLFKNPNKEKVRKEFFSSRIKGILRRRLQHYDAYHRTDFFLYYIKLAHLYKKIRK